MLGGASDPREPAGKDAVGTLNKFLKFALRLPFDYFSEIRLAKISEESRCPRTAAVSTASVVFCVLPTVHNKPSAADRNAKAGDAPTITDASSKKIRNIVRSPTTARRSGARLIPTIFRTTARSIRKQSNEIANASNGGTKSVASSGLKRTT